MKGIIEKHVFEVVSLHGGIDFQRNSWGWRWWSSKRMIGAIAVFFLISIFLFAALAFAGLLDSSIVQGIFAPISFFSFTQSQPEFQLQCFQGNQTTRTCPRNTSTISYNPTNPDHPSNHTCPSYFRWIHHDLRHWNETGITREMLEKARNVAHFRVVILNGRVYVEKYRDAFQTRDLFSMWGFLQLLRRYPGRLPDLELMFNCDDHPRIQVNDLSDPKVGPPAMFHYCSDQQSFDIVFPDWSFWGWAEINIKPWADVMGDIKEGAKRAKWKDRVPYAFWKGNPHVSPSRMDLLNCNVNGKTDWNARLYVQDWGREIRHGFKNSNLGDQCTHRYKIYIEGRAWSVSEKYILACDSMCLYVTPHYYDFFSRELEPLQHFWPIREDKKCTSIKFAVDWGNNHTDKAEEIGKTASKFMQEDLKMDYVYDYMYHVLNEYAKLLRFKPIIPQGAMEICSEALACPATGTLKKFMVDSMVKSPSNRVPCHMPPPYHLSALQKVVERRAEIVKQVEEWEDEYWNNENKKS